jgi:hypothetical protein
VQATQNSLAKNQEFRRNLHLPHKESSLYLQKCKFFSVFFRATSLQSEMPGQFTLAKLILFSYSNWQAVISFWDVSQNG